MFYFSQIPLIPYKKHLRPKCTHLLFISNLHEKQNNPHNHNPKIDKLSHNIFNMNIINSIIAILINFAN